MGVFDLLVFDVILVLFGILVSNWPVTRKRMFVEGIWLKFGTREHNNTSIEGIALFVLKDILEIILCI